MTPHTFTPGPWKVERMLDTRRGENRTYYLRANKGETLAEIVTWESKHDKEWQANANLIAAAPELLKSIENTLACVSESPLGRPLYDIINEMVEHLQAVLAEVRR